MPKKRVSSLKLSKKHKDQLREWVAALRSGKYRQGPGVLRRPGTFGGDDEFCCLGVWCDLRPNPRWLFGPQAYYAGKTKEFETVPADLWAGNPVFKGFRKGDIYVAETVSGNRIAASTANDDEGWSFKKIATSVEKYYQLKEKAA